MEQKAFTLLNRGMNRDLSISKVGESSAYENWNMRIIARNDDTFLSVTNERGTKETGIQLPAGETLIGWNVLNEHLIFFTHDNSLGFADRAVTEASSLNQLVSAYCESVRSSTTGVGMYGYSLFSGGGNNITARQIITAAQREFSYGLYTKLLEEAPNHLRYAALAWGTDSEEYAEFNEHLNSAISAFELFAVEDAHGEDYTSNAPYVSGADNSLIFPTGHIIWIYSTNGMPAIYQAYYDQKVAERAEMDEDNPNLDNIYRIDYDTNSGFYPIVHLFNGNLGFSVNNPIESVVYYETDDVQKIYWVDGKNVLRFMNFMAKTREVDGNNYYPWQDDEGNYDNTYFDSNRQAKFDVSVSIDKDNSGNPRANGVAQYLLTYFNKHGQETNYVWISDLVYLTPEGRGGAADGQNNNRVVLNLSNLDTSYDHFRVYMVLRTTLDGQTVAYLVSEGETADKVTVVDDGAHLTLQDANRLLYLGSQPVVAGTMTHKDQTLFLGDLKSIGRGDIYEELTAITDGMYDASTGLNTGSVEFFLTNTTNISTGIANIPYVEDEGLYPYNNQLAFTSGQIMSFKGNEKYRFALKFQLNDGKETDSFWIGDKENTLYPVVNDASNTISRPIAKCTLDSTTVARLQELGVKTVQMMIAEASYADRSVKAQGFVNPTMFNVWERYNNRIYGVSSWILRPRFSEIAHTHFQPVHNSTTDTSEIECNYWSLTGEAPTPYFRYKTVTINGEKTNEYYTDYSKFGADGFTHYCCVCFCSMTENLFILNLNIQMAIVGASANNDYLIDTLEFNEQGTFPTGVNHDYWFSGNLMATRSFDANAWDKNLEELAAKLNNYLTEQGFSDTHFKFKVKDLEHWFYEVLRPRSGATKSGFFNRFYGSGDTVFSTALEAYNVGLADTPSTGAQRWYEPVFSAGDAYKPAFYTKNFMFVDENLVTMNSPEVSYEAVNLDETTFNFRVVGVAKMSSVISDYDVSASQGDYAGENLFKWDFSDRGSDGRLSGLTAWPLWMEHGLLKRVAKDGEDYTFPTDLRNATPSDYSGYSSNIVYYWFYLWGRTNSITGYNNENESKSILNKKTIGNLHFSYKTIYGTGLVYPGYSDIKFRLAEKYSSQLKIVDVDNETRYYSGSPEMSLSCPGLMKYPIRYLDSRPDVKHIGADDTAYLYSSEPIKLSYLSDRHLVFSLGTEFLGNKYKQNILPFVFGSESEETDYTIPIGVDDVSCAILPWIEGSTYNVFDYNKNNIDEVTFASESVIHEGGKTFLTAHSESSYTIRTPDWFSMIKATNSNGNVISYFGEDSVYYGYIKVNTGFVDEDTSEPIYYEYLVDLSGLRKVDGYYRVDNADVLFVRVPGPPTYEEEEQRVAVNYLHIDSRNNARSSASGERWVVDDSGNKLLNPFSHDVYNESLQIEYSVLRKDFSGIPGLKEGEPYVLIGEVYQDFSQNDTRYGGITKNDVAANRFITAGPQYDIASMNPGSDIIIYANQGDTYFQRWDCLKTVPYSSDSVNNVIDATSVMLETHINLDGRTDTQRGMNRVAFIDSPTFGQINNVYSQKNNFKISRDLDSDFNTDAYRSSLTWTLQKNDMADVDEWTHITLASNLKLDGDKGPLNALRRYRNSIMAFQDRGISEILFNSRTQLTTNDGVPVEIANSGKVDGKRYITNKYGCLNKWSITEGKNALYFVDNINKAFCSLTDGVDNLSRRLGFSVEFSRINSMEPWTPDEPKNFVSFYDRVHSDVYLVAREATDDGDFPCLVYNELLGTFTSFFDYGGARMMTNIGDKFVSFANRKLWYQNEGLFGEIYGTQYPFHVVYRVTPNPYTDKIWTNIDYRADFYRTLRVTGGNIQEVAEDSLNDNNYDGLYRPDETFDVLRVYNEYQDTGNFIEKAEKKFRIWRYAIPRSKKNNLGGYHTKYGLDRIRNPWVYIRMDKVQENDERQDLMQLHDVTVRYFE